MGVYVRVAVLGRRFKSGRVAGGGEKSTNEHKEEDGNESEGEQR